jgi:hypothetical protein
MEQETSNETLPKEEPKQDKKKWDDVIVDVFKLILQYNKHEYGGKSEILK